MAWNLEEAVAYYKGQGAPGEQTALTALLREIQRENGNGIPVYMLAAVAETYGIKESFLLALIKRIPSLRVENTHCLELCAGPNCGKAASLAACAEKLCGASGGKMQLKYTQCMRMCGKGPNLKWDGKMYNGATEALIKQLFQDIT